jgi:hypothetical protein
MDIVFGKREMSLWQSQGLEAQNCGLPCCNPEAVDTIIVRFSIDLTSVSAFLRD